MRPVLLIDEIDKADIEFPNDLLRELDRMEFYVYETRQLVKARHRPDHRHHQQQREGAAGCIPAALLLPLHPVSRRRARCSGSSTCTFPGLKKELLAEALDGVLRGARDAGSEEEALDVRAARLDQAAGGRGYSARKCCARAIRRRSFRRCTARC